MPSLSDRLKALGVQVGAQDLRTDRTAQPPKLDDYLGGEPLYNHFGQTYVVHTLYESGYQHGEHIFPIQPPLVGLAAYSHLDGLAYLPMHAFAFLDTETTGLSGGTGTYAFLIGVGRFEEETFHLAQFFMQDPLQEPAQLAALEEFLAPCAAIVSFNGKSFDLPLLVSRYISNGWKTPFGELFHLDLLHLSRRLWRDRLPSRTLAILEAHVLGASRTAEDIPGWMIPQIFFDYLRSGDPTQLRNVFYHNRMDVVSLAALLNRTALMLADPFNTPVQDDVELLALARLFEDMSEIDKAEELYRRAIASDMPEHLQNQSLLRLAKMCKARGDYEHAIRLWVQAAHRQQLEAAIELAKTYEHRYNDYTKAIFWTNSAIQLVNALSISNFEKRQMHAELDHRLIRLNRKHR